MNNSNENPPLTPNKSGKYPRKPFDPRARDLRVIMAWHNLSVSTVAEILGQSIQTISRWRNGAPPPPEWMLRLLRHELAARDRQPGGGSEGAGCPECKAA